VRRDARFVNVMNEEEGLSLVELVFAMLILSVVVVTFGATLVAVQRAAVKEAALSQTLNQARLALEQLDRQIRSGNVLYDPALEGGSQPTCTGCLPYYTVRVYTQANADTASSYYCTLWKIDSSGVLSTRQWPPDDPTSATGWYVVATGILSRSLGERVFTLDSDPLKGSRTLNMSLAVNTDSVGSPTKIVRVQAAITGRNTSYGFPTGVCTPTPSG
jgi:type II secretory pathway pseudopilin PulG